MSTAPIFMVTLRSNLADSEIAVGTLPEVRKKIAAYRDNNGLGGSNWPAVIIENDAGTPVATVSYNGRLWEPKKKWPEAKELTEQEIIAASTDDHPPTEKDLVAAIDELLLAAYNAANRLPAKEAKAKARAFVACAKVTALIKILEQ